MTDKDEREPSAALLKILQRNLACAQEPALKARLQAAITKLQRRVDEDAPESVS